MPVLPYITIPFSQSAVALQAVIYRTKQTAQEMQQSASICQRRKEQRRVNCSSLSKTAEFTFLNAPCPQQQNGILVGIKDEQSPVVAAAQCQEHQQKKQPVALLILDSDDLTSSRQIQTGQWTNISPHSGENGLNRSLLNIQLIFFHVWTHKAFI